MEWAVHGKLGGPVFGVIEGVSENDVDLVGRRCRGGKLFLVESLDFVRLHHRR